MQALKRITTYLHPKSLSPDPTYGKAPSRASGNQAEIILHPHALLRVCPESPSVMRWKRTLNLFHRPDAIELTGDEHHRVTMLIDFGTEVDAKLIIDLKLGSDVNLMACFGESEPEAEGLVPGHHPIPTYYWHLDKGNQHVESETRGFRFVRLVFSDVKKPLLLGQVAAHATLTFKERHGDFQCSDPRFQRVWQSSVYTARLCTKKDTIWDGIKRDRVGWYGDARIIKLAADNVFFDPKPAEAMLMALPTDEWANCIPNYSFDAIAMLRQHMLFYGADRPCVRPCYNKILELLAWAWRTQTNRDGFIIRTDRRYFGNIGFLDWGKFPVGGRLEELCWLQCKYLEGLRNTEAIAVMLGDHRTVSELTPRIAKLARLIVKRFWNQRKGFVHTLNHVGNPQLPPDAKTGWAFEPHNTPGYEMHYAKTYVEKVRLGPSGPSRQSNALAVLAGLTSANMGNTVRRRVFDNPDLPPIITAYFLYYEQRARALCGDSIGAIMNFRDYIGNMLETEDSATVWELYNPEVTDLRKYIGLDGRLWTWPISLCHGWGAGAVPIAAEFLLGINPVAPGFSTVDIKPCTEIPWSFEAAVPTPHGIIRVERERERGIIHYTIPKGIQLTPETKAGILKNGICTTFK